MAGHLDEFLLRIKALLFKRRLDRDLVDELAFHEAMLKEKSIMIRSTRIIAIKL